MPWCEGCSRFFNPNTLTAEGSCPKCGKTVGVPATAPITTAPSKISAISPSPSTTATTTTSAATSPPKSAKIPWHFWLLVSAATIYLGWRLIQGIAALVG